MVIQKIKNMKNELYFFASLSVLALAFWSCDSDKDIVVPNTTVIEDNGKPFVAMTESYSPETKTSLNNGNVLWKTGDQVSVFAASTINDQYQVTDGSNGKTSASLNKINPAGFVAGVDLDDNVAYYPYSASNEVAKNGSDYDLTVSLPSTQNYAENSFGNGAFPMAAVTNGSGDMNLTFKNVLGGLKLQLKGTATISRITVTGNNNEILYGDATVTASKSAVPSIVLSDASAKVVTLDCGAGVTLDAETATNFIIALPPMTMTRGFTVTVIDSERKQMEIETTKSQTIARSSILKMPVVVYDGTTVNSSPYEMVDLGLPSGVKWANMNIGASSPSSEGTWFAFGDVIGSSQYKYYDEDVYVNLIGGSGEIYGPGDPLASYSVLPPSHDAATVLMGENWRTPTEDDFYELFNYCDVSVDGTAIRFISQINGAELILFRDSYWCSQKSWDKQALCAFPEYQHIDVIPRRATNQIRGVYGLPKLRPTLDYQVTISDITNTGALISSNITNDGGAEISERGFYIKIGSSSNYDVLVVPGAGVGEFSLTLSGLSHVTQYSVAAYATNSVGTSQSSWKSFRTDRNPIPAEYKGTLDGHDWVDIGLRKSHIDSNIVPGSSEDRIIAFATENIGASSPDNTGYYFRWGEQMGWDITVQDGYSSLREYSAVQRDRDGNVTSEVWSSSTFGSGYLSTGNNEERATGFFQDVTRKTDLQWYSYTYGDAATYNWGENWMTPSIAIFKAMLSVEQSKINFGEVSTNVNPLTFGTGANSLTLTISKETINGHLCLLLINDETDAYVIIPTYGGYTSGTYVSSYGSSGLGCYHTSSIRWDDKRYVPICRFDSWSSSSWFLIYSFGNKYEGRAVRPVTELTLDSKQPLFTDEEVPETIEEVDLGLSVKWASMNLGAKNKYDCGLFYRFGELTGHGCFDTFDRSWSSYFTSIGGNGNSSSDCGGSKDPLADYKGIVIPLEFDAAHETLGGTWRMPTRQEIQELVDNCTITWLSTEKTHSICAMKATSNVNGKSIIIPLSGYYYPSSTGYYATNRSGCFWSSSLGVNFVGSGYNISMAYYGVVSNSNYTLRTEYVDRNYAIPIRAVKE